MVKKSLLTPVWGLITWSFTTSKNWNPVTVSDFPPTVTALDTSG